MKEREDKDDVGDVGGESDIEDGKCEETEAETDSRNGEHSKTGEAEHGRKLTP
jgi:hypothetical protein